MSKNFGHLKIKDPNTVSPEAKKALTQAKVGLYRLFPYMGLLVMGTDYHWSDELPTAAATTIGGNKIFINEDFFLGKNSDLPIAGTEERIFVVAHELLHIFLEHIGRARENSYHPMLWNVPTDYCINLQLHDSAEARQKNSKLNITMRLPESTKGKNAGKTWALFDTKYRGWSADKIYYDLLQQHKNDPKKAAEANGAGQPGDEDGMPGKPGENGQCPMDEVSAEEVSDGTKVKNRQKISASINGDPGARKAAAEARQMGDGSSDMLRQLEQLLESKISWKSMLRQFVNCQSKQRYTYNRLSRRSTKTIVFPSMTGDHINMAFGVDTSGSMSENDLNECVSELGAILNEFESWNFTLMSCDTVGHIIGEFSSEDGDDITTVIKKGLIGGGGTDMNPMIELSKELEHQPDVLIICTDGFIPPVDSIEDEAVIMVVTSAGSTDFEAPNATAVIQIDGE